MAGQRSFRVSDLQAKGAFTVVLVLLAESVYLTNSVSFWSTYQSWSHESRSKHSRKNSFFARAVKLDGTCTSHECARRRPNVPPARLYPRLKRECRKVPVDCCVACTSYMDEDTALEKCNIPRGGGLPVKEAVETLADSAVRAKTPYDLPLNGWKVLFQAFLTFINVFCWFVPLKSKKITENKLALSLANAFSGGVFLSLAFGHLIPECVHGFDGYNEVTPYMLVLGGYLLIFFVEKVAFDAHGALHELEHQQDKPLENGAKKERLNGEANSKSSSRGAVILLGALAVHSVLEMTALGLADSFGDAALLTLSIALHQPAESIALLVAFLKSGMPKNQIIQFLSIFSAMGPIGVALGMAVNEFAAPIVDAIMLATVAGTFVYVGATEVIPEEWEEPEHKWKKFGALMSGIVSIFLITQYTMSLEGMSG